MTTQTDAIKLAIEALEYHQEQTRPIERTQQAISALRAALQEQASSQPASIKTWQQRLEEACPALGPLHIHACVEEVNDAMQAEIDDLRSALQEQAPEADDSAPWLTKAHMLCTDHGIPQGHIEQRLELLRVMFAAPVQAREQDKADAERYRWLTDDHADAEMRDRAEYIGIRLRWICKGAADATIDAAMLAASPQEQT